jgi:hypothetical protein
MFIFNISFYLRLIFLFWSDLIIICLKLRLCCGIAGSNINFAGSDLGSDFGFDCLAFDFFCDCCCGDCDLIIKWLGDGSINNGFGGGGIGNEGARGGGIGKNEGGR